MIELDIRKSALQAMALFVSPRAGSNDPNPNAAIHLRYIDPSTLRVACSNGAQTAYLRLHKDSDQLTNFDWPEEEMEKILSIHLNGQAMGAIAKMGNNIILSTELLSCTIRGDGDVDGTSVKVPRLTGRQISLFDDMENAQPATQEDCVARGQFTINAKALFRIAKAAKPIGYGGADSLDVAYFGWNYGITVGSDANFWVLMSADSVSPPKDAGLPPYWLTGDKENAESLVDALDNLTIHVEEEEDAAEQAQLEFSDEHAPANIDALTDEHEDGGGDRFDLEALPETDTATE